MRYTPVILALFLGIWFSRANATDHFDKIIVDTHVGFIIPAKWLLKSKFDPLDLEQGAIGFWTPSLKEIEGAEHASHQAIYLATQSPEKAFPEIAKNPGGYAVPTLDHLKKDSREIDKNYNSYIRQFVGLVLFDGRKHIYCNYLLSEQFDEYTPKVVVEESDPSKHFIQMEDGGAGYWQTIYDVKTNRFVSLSINSTP